ncbi:protein MpCupin104 [Marchantia polymorpha subsp. ruderalis]|uniref:JmjC domain-containing protein n=1 Tax=Marchantia polymorpha TaxID=3197 RepID=A0A2R6WCV2_MARPO|nr:hypothetical protein MARPO_0108s0029 [Marchantia polymorpha]BBN19833.1 hypothetical protein Mp_8g14040 [Marchantia polymorpha subsp. ruderalis]|eukprot:PTQ31682.1 hypothetical protein MARPO_0108s0029 [Marchantia polymorpha]
MRSQAMASSDGDVPGQRSHLKVLGEVARVSASEYDYGLFWKEYMRANKPVVLTGLMESWRSCEDWVLESGAPNLDFIGENFGSSRVQVADCARKEFSDQKRQDMTVRQFVDYWSALRDDAASNCNSESRLLYLKDWHFVKEFPAYCAYNTPEAFSDDWLNTFLDAFQMHSVSAEITPKSSNDDNQCSDYRFVYMGPKGTWTPLHADVLRSYSWSANVCGRKKWLLLPPEQVELVYDRFRRNTVYDIFSEVSEQQFPGFSQTRWMECDQGPGEILFVPSGWFHQVTNVEDTISINHNWLNGCNLHWAWKLLRKEYRETVESIEDIRSIANDFEMLCQRNLAANSGMNYLDFAIFVAKMVDGNIGLLWDLFQKSFGEKKLALIEDSVWKCTIHQCLFNLLQMKQILEEMILEDAFQLGDSFAVTVNCKFLESVYNVRAESDDCTAPLDGKLAVEYARSPEMRFISAFFRVFSLMEDTVSSQPIEITDLLTEDDQNLSDAKLDQELPRQRAAEDSGPLLILKAIQYVLDTASGAGLMASYIDQCSVTIPVTLTLNQP